MLSSASSAQTNAFFTTLGEMQTVPHFTSLREARQRLRESNLTMQSGTTSSVYPLSSSTVSGTESPCSPRSIADSFQDNHITSVDPDEPYDDYQAFNTDDVSYRLRLLVSNNYFLPPAHAKPSPSAFASPVIAPSKKTAKSAGPAFLDIFRVGKVRSKPTALSGPVTPELGPPRLRTTADSTITSSRVTSTRAAPVPRGPVSPALVTQTSRVAVVREKVDNLALAAEQAEQELKIRVDAKQNSAQHFDDYVDPTDTVDLPPPSENSPFAFQASALRGLGVENSLGAAVLAERLPPGSPGVWSLDPDEEAWRKALLHEAVGHSLNNTPAGSFHTSSHVATPSSGSMEPSFARSSPTPAPRASTPGVKRNLGQRIVEILEEQHETIVSQSLSPQDAIPQSPSQLHGHNTSPMSHSSQFPLRAETPADPQTVLPPPPRPPVKPMRSSISTDSPGESQRMSQLSTSASTLRKTSSSPMLHLWHEPGSRRSRAVVSMTPPLLPRGRASSVAISSAPFTPRDSMTSGSHYSVQDPEFIDHLAEPDPMSTRPSFSSLLSRPSMSEYSQISPTVSAFNDGHFESASSFRESIPPDSLADHEDTGGFRDPESIRHLSPPPRASSSFAIHSLHPPPRFLSSRDPSPTLIVAQLPSLSPYPSNSSSDPGNSSERLSAYATAYATVAEQSDSPSSPLREHRAVDASSTLQLSSLSIPSSIHSAPPPASPLEFFDQIDCDVMDDWETSDESDEDADSSEFPVAAGSTAHGSSQGHSSVLHAPRMTSTPSISPAVSRDDLSVQSGSQERSPVGNVPRPPIYFKDTMGDQGLSSYDLYQLSRSAAASSSSRISSDTQVRGSSVEDRNYARKEGWTASMQRLDGLMLQHIEAERGTLSRIAKTVKDAHS